MYYSFGTFSVSFFLAVIATLSLSSAQSLSAVECQAKLRLNLSSVAVAYDDVGDYIYVFGGYNSERYPTPIETLSKDILRYSLVNDTVELVHSFYFGIFDGVATTDGLGSYFYFGGRSSGQLSGHVYKFTPADGSLDTTFSYTAGPVIDNAGFQVNSSMAVVINGGSYSTAGLYAVNTADGSTRSLTPLSIRYQSTSSFWDRQNGLGYIFGKAPISSKDNVTQSQERVTIYNPLTNERNVIALDFPIMQDFPVTASDDENGYAIGVFSPANTLMQFNFATHAISYYSVDNFLGYDDKWFSRSGSVYVKKLDRIYFFGGLAYGPDIRTDGIWYIDLSPIRNVTVANY